MAVGLHCYEFGSTSKKYCFLTSVVHLFIIFILKKIRCARVFSDKLTNLKDKAVYASYMEAQLAETFGPDMTAQCKESFYMVNFLRPDVFDEEGVLVQEAPKMYEPGGNHYYLNE